MPLLLLLLALLGAGCSALSRQACLWAGSWCGEQLVVLLRVCSKVGTLGTALLRHCSSCWRWLQPYDSMVQRLMLMWRF